MDEIQIAKIIKHDSFAKRYFVGVFSRTRIPIPKKIPASYVINLDSYGSKGFHWIGVFITPDKIYIFDSFGGNFMNDSKFSSFLASFLHKRTVLSSPIVVQNFSSSTCGLYCILFILLMSRKCKFNDFICLFNRNNLNVNDEAIVTYFGKNKFKKLL